ncbi:BZ3500_MvSof-1268-A1-R1_Chr2-3g05390 [Microbotryum saponariae]|uniref:BZ3500_MvSof-1268-A1-R1_Chr2-3g05390 protein n=1 Tax=Microbotryum saponariae TaxID=289078 RepID=A0A2X0K591_9BASI|nr:BZ3500_MvSof-1268-A1-R1_Chr2-3g05390 [Microbotryum saponariae]SDA01345.1 BZ3501_MvSof-1269-A2-R1_Chr2-2g05063 [Microbotryum saponariae]
MTRSTPVPITTLARYPLFSESTAASLPSPLAHLPNRSSSPLFPASPPHTSPSPIASTSAAPTRSQQHPPRAPSIDRERRTSRAKSVRELDSGSIVLATPSADSFSLRSASSVHHDSHVPHSNPTSSPVPSMAASLSPAPDALPSHIALPMAPHLVPSSNLAALPIEQLVALVMALSEDRDSITAQLETRQRECEALETICRDAGVGPGEVDRAKVRARVVPSEHTPQTTTAGRRPSRSAPIRSREWRIALLPPTEAPPTSSTSDLETSSEQPPASATHLFQVDLDLDDLAEAMGENGFQVPNAGTDTANEGASNESATSETDITPSSTISKARTGNRGRHASLSSRLFGSILLAGTSSSPPPLPVPDLNSSTAAKDTKKDRRKRSDSAQSSSSVASGTSSIVCNDSVKSDDPTTSPANKGTYEGWIGWKNWRAKEKKSTLASSVFETETTSSIRSSGGPDEAGSDRVESPTIDVDATTALDEDELATPMPKPNRTSDFFALTSPTRPRKGSSTLQPRPNESVSPPEEPVNSASPPSASILSAITTATAISADETSSLVSPTESDTSSASSATPDRKPCALEGPGSPLLTRPRVPSAPSLSHQQAHSASVSAAEGGASLSRTSSSRSSRSSRQASSTVHDDLSTSAATIEEPVTTIETPVQGLKVVQEDGDTTADADNSASSISTPSESLTDASWNADRTIKARRRVSANLSERKSPALVQAIMTPTAKETPLASAATNPGYVASAKGAFGRALGFGSTPSSPKMARSLSEGMRRASGASSMQGEPNLTLFPKLPTLSKYSPAAPAALSTPSTVVSLSAHATPSVKSPPLMPMTPTISSSAAIPPTMMELGVISGEAAPPTLALHNPTSGQAASAGEEGPMVDRYGFVYDVRSGMKLLREARKKQERSMGNGGSRRVFTDMGHDHDDDNEEDQIVAVPGSKDAGPAVDAVQSQAELDAELEMLREALGIPPPSSSRASSPTAVRSPTGPRSPVPSLAPSTSTTTSTTPHAPHLTSSVSSDRPATTASITSPTAPTSGPQSMKRLLTQLREMSDVQDQKRKLEWDTFISKRQAKLAKIGSSGMSGSTNLHNGLEDGKDSTHSAATRKRASRSVVVQSDQINAFSNSSDDEGDKSKSRATADEQAWRCEDLVGVSQMGVDGKSGKEDWAEFKQLVRKGVPIAYRPKIWAECSGANEAREPGVYQDLLAHKNEENQCLNQIDMDCELCESRVPHRVVILIFAPRAPVGHRTFPTNVFFAGTGPGVAKLRNVLVAYSRHNPLIGYCQGMNNLTATLLLTHPAEEDAFWVLVCIIEVRSSRQTELHHRVGFQTEPMILGLSSDCPQKILPSDYYTSHLLVSQADQRVLKTLVVRLMPDLAAHLEDLGVELPAITFGWFLSLFTDALPIQTLLRIWDLIFVFGTVMLFRVAVAILKLHETEILSCDSAATLYALIRAMTTHLYQVDKLLKIACEDLKTVIKDREVSTLRMKHVNDLQQELGIFPEERRE